MEAYALAVRLAFRGPVSELASAGIGIGILKMEKKNKKSAGQKHGDMCLSVFQHI